jgi:hypothetical protein
LDITLSRPLATQIGGHLFLHRGECLEREVRVERLGAVAGEHREVVHLARRTGLDHEADLGAQAGANQMVVHGAGGQQHRDRQVRGIGLAVGEDQNVRAVVHRLFRSGAQPIERCAHAATAMRGGITDAERRGTELVLGKLADGADLLHVGR